MITRVTLFSLLLGMLCASCASVKPYQKACFSDRIMIYDYDATSATLRGDILSAREGSTGGSSTSVAGGCSCK